MENRTLQLLLLEDEQFMADHVIRSLREVMPDAEVVHTRTYDEALALALGTQFDCLILDRNVIGGDGLGLVSALREKEVRTPALMLTNLNSAEHQIEGWSSGADAYEGKDFEPMVLKAQIQNLIRRAAADGHPRILRIGFLELHRTARTAMWMEKDLDLEPQQFALLLCIAEASPGTASYQQIWKEAWPEFQGIDPQKQTIQTNLSRLRRKIDKAGAAITINSVDGGYSLEV